MEWNLVGAFSGAAILTVFLVAAGHRSSRGQRVALIGLGLAIFTVPTYLGSVMQDRVDQSRATEQAASTEARIQARFDQLSGQLDQAFRGILSALANPNQSPEQRRLAVAAAVGRYNQVAARLGIDPVEPLPVPPVESPASGSRAPATQPQSEGPVEQQRPAAPTETQRSDEADTAPVVAPPVLPPPVIVPPPPPPPPPPP